MKIKGFSWTRGQAAMELALFGAVVIFIIGGIVNIGMSAAYRENQTYKALRQAMTASYLASEAGNTSRNTASILFIEDRLSVRSSKYGALERAPYVIGSSATHSKQLFQPMTAGETQNLPIYDIYINGQHFPLTTAAFKTVCLTFDEADCPAGSEWIFRNGSRYQKSTDISTSNAFWDAQCTYTCPPTPLVRPEGCPACPANGACAAIPAGPDCTTPPCPPCPPCPVPYYTGCVKLRRVIFNVKGASRWCDDQATCSDVAPSNLDVPDRFDLDWNGRLDDGIDDTKYPYFADFFWQWYVIRAVDEAYSIKPTFSDFGETPDPVPVTQFDYEGIVVADPEEQDPDRPDPKNTDIDIDGDLKMERILKIEDRDLVTGIILSVQVLDAQEGDIDMSYNSHDYKDYQDFISRIGPVAGTPKPPPGLTNDVRLYARVKEGTYLRVEEGKLFAVRGDSKQYVRQTQRRDQVDLIERVIVLSNDTDRFCDASGNPTNWAGNPVEACNNCFTAENITKTCMDEGDWNAVDANGVPSPRPPTIFVRSRIGNKSGRRWVTNVDADPYIAVPTP